MDSNNRNRTIDRGTILGVPNAWRYDDDGGEKHPMTKSFFPFLCVGVGCWSATSPDWDGRKEKHIAWKLAGTERMGLRGKNSEWQGMCKACVDGGRGTRTTSSIEDVRKRLERIKAEHQSPTKPQPPTIITKFMMGAKLIMNSLSVVAVIVVSIAVIAVGALKLQPHNEMALLTDWSTPPPWPIFIVMNVLAGSLRAVADALTPPPFKVLNMVFGAHQTQLVHVVQKFKIPDLLADGPLTAAEIATKIGSDASFIERIMYACAANGIFKLATPAPDQDGHRFFNTALSAVLRSDHPNSMRWFAGHIAEDVYPGLGMLADFVANPSGPVGWEMVNPNYPNGENSLGLWDYFGQNPTRNEQFTRAMMAIDSLGANAMVEDGPFARFRRVIDVGGGCGHFTHKILLAHLHLRGVVIGRPAVISLAKKAWAEGGEFASAANRVELKEGSFFHAMDIPKGMDGDVYFMRYVLHDWQTDEILTILRKIHGAMGNSNSTLLIGEFLLPDHDIIGVPPVIYSYYMDVQLMVFSGSAKERTLSQWKDIFDQCGFTVVRSHVTRSLLHWVEAKPI
jgi:hypothetical protein